MDLPEKYLMNMKELLADRYGEFFDCYQKPPVRGLRFNKRKVRPETMEKLIREWNLEKVPWAEYGYYYGEDVRPGLSPYHDAGVFYIQEPSAMAVAEMAGIRENDVVLDLCAAPGGKSTRISELCGMLLSNEIIPERARILSSNIERMGDGNVIVSNTSSEKLSVLFPEYFDAVFCDMPCSGEGMMRKDATAVSEWSYDNVLMCAKRQRDILSNAEKTVKPGGKLVYSTCTFEKTENEDMIGSFLKEHPDFSLLCMERFWPHEKRGEGHFIAVLGKGGELREKETVRDALRETEKKLSKGKVHILRSGIVKGETSLDKKGNLVYTPSQAEIMASSFETCENGVNLLSEALCEAYLSGMELHLSGPDSEIRGKEGFLGVYYDGYPLGPGKRKGDCVKNHLPKGLRHFR